jgi:hypothetical protein
MIRVWGTAFLAGCSNYIAAALLTLAVLGAMVWLYWHGWLWSGALALIGGMLAFAVYSIVEGATLSTHVLSRGFSLCLIPSKVVPTDRTLTEARARSSRL